MNTLINTLIALLTIPRAMNHEEHNAQARVIDELEKYTGLSFKALLDGERPPAQNAPALSLEDWKRIEIAVFATEWQAIHKNSEYNPMYSYDNFRATWNKVRAYLKEVGNTTINNENPAQDNAKAAIEKPDIPRLLNQLQDAINRHDTRDIVRIMETLEEINFLEIGAKLGEKGLLWTMKYDQLKQQAMRIHNI